MYLATTDTETAKASPRVFAARHEKISETTMVNLIFKIVPPLVVIVQAIVEYVNQRP
nr:MAG TPA: hypothetical protein [Caudoviricetes sp.]